MVFSRLIRLFSFWDFFSSGKIPLPASGAGPLFLSHTSPPFSVYSLDLVAHVLHGRKRRPARKLTAASQARHMVTDTLSRVQFEIRNCLLRGTTRDHSCLLPSVLLWRFAAIAVPLASPCVGHRPLPAQPPQPVIFLRRRGSCSENSTGSQGRSGPAAWKELGAGVPRTTASPGSCPHIAAVSSGVMSSGQTSVFSYASRVVTPASVAVTVVVLNVRATLYLFDRTLPNSYQR